MVRAGEAQPSALLPLNASAHSSVNASVLGAALGAALSASAGGSSAIALHVGTLTAAAPSAGSDEGNVWEHQATLSYFILSMCAALGNVILIGCMGIGCLFFGYTQDVDPPEQPTKGTCCCLVPCLLDHEAPIIVETVRKALEVSQLRAVVLTYNTKGGDVSSVLKDLETLRAADQRLVLLHNAEAKSKAANLNAALRLTEPDELTLILDADHHIDDAFVSRLSRALRAAPPEVACMQGSVLVRGATCWELTLSTLCWYFFSIVLPMFQTIAGTCMFVGAGAVWRADVLRHYAFAEGMIAEDDDLSMRVIRAGMNVHVCPQAELTELAPASVYAFFSQRLRWTYGYEQSMNRHLCGLIADRPRAVPQRIYAWYSYIVFFLGIAQAICAAVLRPQLALTMDLLPLSLLALPVAILVVAVVRMLQLNGYKRTLQTCVLLPTSFVYGMAQSFLTIYARLRMICGLEWRVTQRRLS